MAFALRAAHMEPERALEERDGLARVRDADDRALDARDRARRVDAVRLVAVLAGGAVVFDESEAHAVGVFEAQRVAARVGSALVRCWRGEPFCPVRQRLAVSRGRCRDRTTRGAGRHRVGEVGEHRPGPPARIGVVEVVGERIVEVDCLLNEAEPEHARVEVEIRRVLGECCDVVDPVISGFMPLSSRCACDAGIEPGERRDPGDARGRIVFTRPAPRSGGASPRCEARRRAGRPDTRFARPDPCGTMARPMTVPGQAPFCLQRKRRDAGSASAVSPKISRCHADSCTPLPTTRERADRSEGTSSFRRGA